MNKLGRTVVVAGLLVIGAAAAYYVATGGSARTAAQKADELETAPPPAPAKQSTGLPRLVDLGAGKCIPCKKMAPILEELKKEYVGRLDVEFIDVWVNPDAGKPYGIKLIPTQIFYDAAGKERFRHEGFMAKEDILAKWKELGIDLSTTPDS